jgi:hypothetical protein
MAVPAQTMVRVAVLLSRLKSFSVHPLFVIAFSVSARAADAGPFDFAASSGLKQLLCVADWPDGAVIVLPHMPGRIRSCACSAVAALSARHITAGITFVLSNIICFLSWVRFSVVGFLWSDLDLIF